MTEIKSNTPSLEPDSIEQLSNKLSAGTKLAVSEAEFLAQVKEMIALNGEVVPRRRINDLVSTLNERASGLKTGVRFRDVGTVQHIGNGIASVSGLPNVSIDEIVTFPTGVEGMALNLEKKRVDLIMLGSEMDIRGGDLVQATGKRLQVPVGAQLLGRIINPLGEPLDSDKPLEISEYRLFSKVAPGVIQRAPVNESLITGTLLIDALFPIGKGQRELIIGDRQTGKTTLAVDAILSQTDSDVRCVYVAIGQKKSATLSVIDTLRKQNALANTIVVVSGSDEQPALRYLAPYTGMTLAEYFLDQGEDVLIVFDDLSKHADAYRELSLLLRRPPGREAYPGDIFYLHSRLLERACKLDDAFGGGSITALPIATTQNNNLASYIPTNLISITDGQLVLDTALFNEGQKPAIDIGRSVSRVGSAAQRPAMRKLVGSLKLDLSQYQEVAQFNRFGTQVDIATRRQIDQGERILTVFKQDPNQPFSFPIEIVQLYALNKAFIENLTPTLVDQYLGDLVTFMRQHEMKLLDEIEAEGQLSDTITEQLDQVLQRFTSTWSEMKGMSS